MIGLWPKYGTVSLHWWSGFGKRFRGFLNILEKPLNLSLQNEWCTRCCVALICCVFLCTVRLFWMSALDRAFCLSLLSKLVLFAFMPLKLRASRSSVRHVLLTILWFVCDADWIHPWIGFDWIWFGVLLSLRVLISNHCSTVDAFNYPGFTAIKSQQ